MAGLLTRIASRWLSHRGVVLLYRGQREATSRILSPLARHDPAASAALVERMRSAGLADAEIAGYAARWHEHPVPPVAAPPGMANIPLGAVGIATTRMVGLAAHFAAGGVVYVLRMPSALAITLPPLGLPSLELEAEHIVLDEVPSEAVVQTQPAGGLPSILVNERDQVLLSDRV